jgi:hypothetical protein
VTKNTSAVSVGIQVITSPAAHGLSFLARFVGVWGRNWRLEETL